MNTSKCNDDYRSEKLDQMVQDALCVLQDVPLDNTILRQREEIIDFIMENPDLPITANQIVFLLRNSYPVVSPKRGDYYDVLARLVSEAKTHGNAQLVKKVYLSIPFYLDDNQEKQRKRVLYQDGIQYFLSLGLRHVVGELYVHLAAGMYFSTAERIQFCESALEFLDPISKEYACVRAIREMLCHREYLRNQDYYHYWAFGETIFRKEKSIFLSPIFPCLTFLKKTEKLCFDIMILKGNRKSYETLTSPDPSGYDKKIVDETMAVGASKCLHEEMELIRLPDETVVCQADGKAYTCSVFFIRHVGDKDEIVIGDMIETHYFARGIGIIHSVLSVRGKDRVNEYVYDLCAYTIKGGDGLLPCCVGNRWCYRQENCPDEIDQVIEREIIAQNGEEYLLSGWNYAGRNLCRGDDA